MEKAKIRPLATPKPLNRPSQKLAGVITSWTAPACKRGKRAQVNGTVLWWVLDGDSKVTGKVSVGHAGLRSSICACSPRPS